MGAPVVLAGREPLSKGLVEGGLLEEEVLGLTQLRGGVGEAAHGVDQVDGVQGGAAVIALVAPGLAVAATRALAFDVAVGQEAAGLGVVELEHRAFVDVTLFEQAQEHFVHGLLVVFGAGGRVEVEADAELAPGFEELGLEALDNRLRRGALLLGADGYGRAVLV